MSVTFKCVYKHTSLLWNLYIMILCFFIEQAPDIFHTKAFYVYTAISMGNADNWNIFTLKRLILRDLWQQ